MPYIKQEKRKEIEPHLASLLNYVSDAKELSEGDLNYIFTAIGVEYFRRKPSYKNIAAVLSGLEGAKLEFYRRIAAPYEGAKIAENGDVY